MASRQKGVDLSLFVPRYLWKTQKFHAGNLANGTLFQSQFRLFRQGHAGRIAFQQSDNDIGIQQMTGLFISCLASRVDQVFNESNFSESIDSCLVGPRRSLASPIHPAFPARS